MAQMWRVRTVWTGVAGAPYYSNLYFSNADGGAATVHDAVADAMSELGEVIDLNAQCVVEAEVPIIESLTGEIVGYDFVGAANVTMAGGAETLPHQVQGLARFRTASVANGRRIQGRMFIPLPPESTNEDNSPSSAYIQAVDVALSPLVSNPDVNLVVWSRTSGVAAPVTSIDVWDGWATLRSRRD